jgi:hypothetical protein
MNLNAITLTQSARGAGLWLTGLRGRRVSVQVKVLVLNQEDMQWAVEHDYRLTTELQDAMRKQRKKLRAMARARKKELQEKQERGEK